MSVSTVLSRTQTTPLEAASLLPNSYGLLPKKVLLFGGDEQRMEYDGYQSLASLTSLLSVRSESFTLDHVKGLGRPPISPGGLALPAPSPRVAVHR